jgi:predicted nuclease of restriction endonuclease-like (RecB) superfamily
MAERTAASRKLKTGAGPATDQESGAQKLQTLSAKSPDATLLLPESPLAAMELAMAFALSWSHYVHLMAVANPEARAFYEIEAIRGGWSVRQLDRQIGTQFYERALHSKNPAALLARGRVQGAQDKTPVEEEIRDPYVLEFLNLKDEYGENELEEALIRHLEAFLLEMGAGFTFVARQKRIRVGDSWYRIDLLLYHRGLRCLVVIDLKTGAFTHADAGQMNLYLNYTKEHLTLPGEADPVGIILCSKKDDAVVKYATGGIRARVFASEYLTKLPDVETLRLEIMKTRRALQARRTEGERD